MRLCSSVVTSAFLVLSIACTSSDTSPSYTLGPLTAVYVSMFGFNGTFTDDGAVLLGRTFQMTATARFSNGGQDVTSAAAWQSSNPDVARISAGGLLTGLATGTTVVTATYDGKTGTLPVRISSTP